MKAGRLPHGIMVYFSSYSTLKMEAVYPPKRGLNFNRSHSVISHKTLLFIRTAARTSNPMQVMLVLDIRTPGLNKLRFNIIPFRLGFLLYILTNVFEKR
jgi:hypothetical protein